MNSRFVSLIASLVLTAAAHAVPVRFLNEGYDWKPYVTEWSSGFNQDVYYLDVRKPWNEQTVVPETVAGVDAPPGAVIYERRDFGIQFPSFDMIRGVVDSAPAWDPNDPRNSGATRVFYSYDYGGSVPSTARLESFDSRTDEWIGGKLAQLIYRFNPNNPSGFPLPTQSFMRQRDVVGIRLVVPGGFLYGWIEMELISIDEGARPIAWGYETELNTPAVIVPEPLSGVVCGTALAAALLTRRSRR
jgi:hypothetical protein